MDHVKEQEESDRLRLRIKVLEVLLPFREQQAHDLRQRRQQQTSVLQITELQASASASAGGWPPRSDLLHQYNNVVHAGGCKLTASNDGGLLAKPAAKPNDEGIIPTSHFAHAPGPADGHESFNLPPDDSRARGQLLRRLMSVWNRWLREGGLALHAHDARPHDPGPQLRIAQLHEELVSPFYTARLEYPSVIRDLLHLNIETGRRDEPPPESFWIPVVQGLRFSSEQVAVSKAALALYHERAEMVRDERRRLAAQLSSSLSLLQGRTPLQGHASGRAPACGQLMLQVEEATTQLHRNMAVEGHAMEATTDFMGHNVFTPVQLIRASVLSCPYLPDFIAILNTMVAMSASPQAGPTRTVAAHS